jgi:cytochrome c oxidase subunit IV
VQREFKRDQSRRKENEKLNRQRAIKEFNLYMGIWDWISIISTMTCNVQYPQIYLIWLRWSIMDLWIFWRKWLILLAWVHKLWSHRKNIGKALIYYEITAQWRLQLHLHFHIFNLSNFLNHIFIFVKKKITLHIIFWHA